MDKSRRKFLSSVSGAAVATVSVSAALDHITDESPDDPPNGREVRVIQARHPVTIDPQTVGITGTSPLTVVFQAQNTAETTFDSPPVICRCYGSNDRLIDTGRTDIPSLSGGEQTQVTVKANATFGEVKRIELEVVETP